MRSLSLYVPRKSFVHDIDSISKLFYIAFAILLPLILPKASVICLLLSLSLLIFAGVIRNALPMFGFILFVLVTVVIIQGLFGVDNVTPFFAVYGLVFYKEGLMNSLEIILRVLNIISSFLILVLTTKPSELVEDLVSKGLSPKVGYVINSVFQIIPQIMSTVYTIIDAQRSRGMETEGNIIVRVKAFIPLLGPVVLSSFMHTKERAMALEVRAFSATCTKTFINERKEYKPGKAIRFSLVAALICAVVWRIFV